MTPRTIRELESLLDEIESAQCEEGNCPMTGYRDEREDYDETIAELHAEISDAMDERDTQTWHRSLDMLLPEFDATERYRTIDSNDQARIWRSGLAGFKS